MENNRTILAIALIVLLWSGYSMFFAPKPPQQPIESVQADSNTSPVSSDSSSGPVNTIVTIPEIDNNLVPLEIKVTNDVFDVVLSSKGGTVKSVDFKNYKEDNTADSGNYYLLNSDKFADNTFKSYGNNGLTIPSNINYSTNSDDTVIVNNDISIKFTGSYGDIVIEKIYSFNKQNYNFSLDINIYNKSTQNISGSLFLSLDTFYNSDGGKMYTFEGPVSYNGKELIEDKVKDLDESSKIHKDNILWSGFTNKYFFIAVNPDNNNAQVAITKDGEYIKNEFVSKSLNIPSGQFTTVNYHIYAGPKKIEDLAVSGQQFEEIIHYGFFHPLAKPLMVVLKFFYSFIGNYGFSIILLTVCIKLIFWPLTQKSYKSMKGMQKLQPEMKKMREKYGSDKQRLNQEMMKFYKENKVNPMGGCLPMLIQIPVFFALYRVLLGSIELRHAPFILWITDLSAKDPYYITPLVMGVTMFLQQKMTPTNMDPTQEKVMLIMPVVFTFMFLNFPAGLVVYWLVNNVLTILQQYLIRRQAD